MLLPKSKFKSSWRSLETLKIESLEQYNDTEFEYQIEEVESFQPKMEVLKENNVIEEIEDETIIDLTGENQHGFKRKKSTIG